MSTFTVFVPMRQLKKIGLNKAGINYQLSADELIEQTLQRNEGVLNNTGALCINTGEFTGRSPKDKFFVDDNESNTDIDWNCFNQPIEEKYFLQLRDELLEFLNKEKEVWVRDCYACADENYRVNIRVINENPWSNLFALNMFIKPHEEELDSFK